LFVGETRTFQVPQKVLQRLYFGGEEQEIEQPHVTICIPTLGREEKLEQLLQSLPFTAQYSNFDVLVEHDSFEKRQGVPALLKKMVSQAKGEFIVFLGNDCMPRPGWLREAMQAMRQNFPAMDGLVGLNDGYWHGEVATHWLASKKLLPFLDGEFFHTGYSHVGCDNELTARCKKAGKYTWCGAAQIYHDHPIQHGFKEDSLDPVYKLAWHPVSVANDRALLKSRAEYLDFASHLIL
jgi:glycosyltransferase involved in cell wall biosynthesis